MKLLHRLIEIDQHDDAGLRRDTGQAMKPTATATDMLKPSHHISQRPPTSANGSDSITISVSVKPSEIEIEQQEDDQQRHRHHDLQPAVARSRYSNWPLQTT